MQKIILRRDFHLTKEMLHYFIHQTQTVKEKKLKAI